MGRKQKDKTFSRQDLRKPLFFGNVKMKNSRHLTAVFSSPQTSSSDPSLILCVPYQPGMIGKDICPVFITSSHAPRYRGGRHKGTEPL